MRGEERRGERERSIYNDIVVTQREYLFRTLISFLLREETTNNPFLATFERILP